MRDLEVVELDVGPDLLDGLGASALGGADEGGQSWGHRNQLLQAAGLSTGFRLALGLRLRLRRRRNAGLGRS